MKILNLVYPDKSDIGYKISQFPDGQQNIVVSGYNNLSYINNDVIQIKTRLNNFKAVELLICATQALRGLKVKEIHLYCPYFLGSRSDRQFESGSVNYLKEVICPIINGLEFASVTVLDPHSDVLEACLDNFIKEDNLKIVQFALFNTYGSSKSNENISLVSPDAGASKKIYKVAEQIGYKGDVFTCSKERGVDGKLSKTFVPKLPRNKDIIIIDDICDGGATFINIAKMIESQGGKNKIYLAVTHGIFSKGFEELSKYFDGIYCTNSYSDELSGRGMNFKFKQLNAF